MIISIIQPCFVPWLGYFEQIAVADYFVYMDDVQYTKKDWRNGNQLKSPTGIKNISFPVRKTSHETLIKDVEISYNQPWEDTLFNQLYNWYKKAQYFNKVVEILKPPIYNKYTKLIELNYNLNQVILNYLNITTPVYFTSNIERKTENKNERIIEICKHFKDVNILYDGKKAQNFIDLQLFKSNNIDVIFQDYQHTPYKQLWGEFVPYMSIIDVLMNCGNDAINIILSSPLPNPIKNNLK